MKEFLFALLAALMYVAMFATSIVAIIKGTSIVLFYIGILAGASMGIYLPKKKED